MLVRSLLAFLLFSIGACSSGGGGDKQRDNVNSSSVSTSSSQSAGKGLALGGVMSGLAAGNTITLDYGKGLMTLRENGEFEITDFFNQGEQFDVSIQSSPSNQTCSISPSTGTVYANQSRVLNVRCADFFNGKVSTILPLGLSGAGNSGVRISSGLERLQLAAEDLSSFDDDFDLMLAYNSLVSLENNGNILYLLFVTNSKLPSYRLDSSSTIQALILSDPLLTTARLERGIGSDELYDDLFGSSGIFIVGGQNSDNYINLRNQYTAGIFERKTLREISEDSLFKSRIYSLMDAAHRHVLSVEHPIFADSSEVVTSSSSSSGALVSGWSDYETSAALVEMKSLAVDGADTLNFYLKNLGHRSVITSNDIPNTALAEGSFNEGLFTGFGRDQNVELPSGIPDGQTVTFEFYGPGLVGEPAQDRAGSDERKEAIVLSGVLGYSLPAITGVIGLAAPETANLESCFDEVYLSELAADVSGSLNFNELFTQNNYSNSFAELNYVIYQKTVKAEPNDWLTQVLSCASISQGYLNIPGIDVDKVSSHLVKMLDEIYFFHRNGSPQTNWFDKVMRSKPEAKITSLTHAVLNSVEYLSVEVSNEIVLKNIEVKRNDELLDNDSIVSVGDVLSFSAECQDPNSSLPIECSITWAFDGNQSKQGNNVEYAFEIPGTYTVKLQAVGPFGAMVSDSQIKLRVIPKKPVLEVLLDGSILTENFGLQFGSVDVGDPVTKELELYNIGSESLELDSDGVFVDDIDSYQAIYEGDGVISPGEKLSLFITYTPKVPGESKSYADIRSNAEPSIFRINLIGAGLGSVTKPGGDSKWDASIQGEDIETFQVVAKDAKYFDSVLPGSRQFQMTLSSPNDQPEQGNLRVKLFNFPRVLEPGTYDFSLSDIVNNVESGNQLQNCNGSFQYVVDGKLSIYCTYTREPFVSAGESYSGNVLITVDADSDDWLVEFEFNAIESPFTCDRSSGKTCKVVYIKGSSLVTSPQ